VSPRENRRTSRTAGDCGRAAGGSPSVSGVLRSEHVAKWLIAAALIAAVFLAYRPAWHGAFLWDDDMHLLNNPVLRPGGLARAWTSGEYLNYWPLTFTVYWLEYKTWGLDPLGFHLVNIGLHAVAALLVWRVLVRLSIPGAMLAAAIFALHPVNVESVAWISQLKNVLSLSLALLSLLFYLGHEREGGWWRLAAAIGLFLLSALAKGMVLTLPVVLLACAWWQRDRLDRRDLLLALPFLLIAALMVWIEVSKQHTGMADAVIRSDGFLGRAAVAGCAVWFYFWKAIWPANLLFIYPRWTISERDLWAYVPGVLLAVILAIAWWRRRSWGRPVVMVIVCYVALLLPILGFADIIFMQYSLVADHWQYAAMIVPSAALAAVFVALGRQSSSPLSRFGRRAGGEGGLQQSARAVLVQQVGGYAFCLGVLAILAVLTYRQSGMYADAETLYRTTLDRNPDCWLTENNLGNLLKDQGRFLESRGRIGDATALYREAIDHYRQALRITPGNADTQLNCGVALGCLGRSEEAITHLRDALKTKPDFIDAHYNLAMALAEQGRFEEAIEHYHHVLDINRDDLPTLNNLAWLRATCSEAAFRNADEAVALAERALTLSSDRQPNAIALDTLAAAYAEAGRFAEAIQAGRRALDLAALQNDRALAERIVARLRLYRAKTPYRQPAAIRPNANDKRSDAGRPRASGRIGQVILAYVL
jgi:protein O-mannosyl-transferase